MAKFLSIFLISLFCQIFLFETETLRASTFKLGSVSVIGNNRLSDEAIINYSRLSRNTVISSEDFNIAYNKILDTGLFKSAAFKKDGRDLIITVEEYPTINEISFEENNNSINIFFDKNSFNILGWQTEDLYQNLAVTYIFNLQKNKKINKEKFILPAIN